MGDISRKRFGLDAARSCGKNAAAAIDARLYRGKVKVSSVYLLVFSACQPLKILGAQPRWRSDFQDLGGARRLLHGELLVALAQRFLGKRQRRHADIVFAA